MGWEKEGTQKKANGSKLRGGLASLENRSTGQESGMGIQLEVKINHVITHGAFLRNGVRLD